MRVIHKKWAAPCNKTKQILFLQTTMTWSMVCAVVLPGAAWLKPQQKSAFQKLVISRKSQVRTCMKSTRNAGHIVLFSNRLQHEMCAPSIKLIGLVECSQTKNKNEMYVNVYVVCFVLLYEFRCYNLLSLPIAARLFRIVCCLCMRVLVLFGSGKHFFHRCRLRWLPVF